LAKKWMHVASSHDQSLQHPEEEALPRDPSHI
jgi:hypothetical protein